MTLPANYSTGSAFPAMAENTVETVANTLLRVAGTHAVPISSPATVRPAGASAVYWIMAPNVWPSNAALGDLIYSNGLLTVYSPQRASLAGYATLVGAIGNAKVSTFADTFPSGDTNWSTGGSSGYTATFSNGLTLSLPAASDYLYALSNVVYDWTNSSCYVNVSSFGTQASGNILLFGAQDNATGNLVYFEVSNSVLAFYKGVSGTYTSMSSVTLNTTSMAWLRLREVSGTTYFDTAPDGVTWTNQYSVADPITLTGAKVYISMTNAGTAYSASLADLNTPAAASATKYPLLGGYLIDPSPDYGDSNYGSPLTSLDLAVLSIYPGWVGTGGQTPAQAVAWIKSQNPNILVANYTRMDQVFTASGSTDQDEKNHITSEVGPNGIGDWYAYTNTGAYVSVYSGTDEVNITSLVEPDSNGYYWSQYAAHRDSTVVISIADYDIWYSDNNHYRSPCTADWARSGTNDAPGTTSSSVSDGWWRAGQVAYYNTARSLQPTKYLMCNCDSDLQSGNPLLSTYGTYPDYYQVMHGALLECVMGQTWSVEAWGGWALMMEWYHTIFNNLLSPKLVVFDCSIASTTDYQAVRYGLASCLMDNGYFYATPNAANNGVVWFDEYNLAGGSTTKWLGTAVDPPQTTAWSNGVFMRRFQNGLALCNPKGNGVQTVTPPSGYTHFLGTQANPPNSGAAVTGTVTLQDRNSSPDPGGDGLLLVKVGTNGY